MQETWHDSALKRGRNFRKMAEYYTLDHSTNNNYIAVLNAQRYVDIILILRFQQRAVNFNLFPGSGHIKFWKIVKTYTGYKLLESLGKFGRTETSDIIGFLALPDAKVFLMQELFSMKLKLESMM